MEIEITGDATTAILHPVGKIDSSTSAEFESTIKQTIEAGSRHVIVDLGKVTFMASAGLRILLGAAKALTGSDRVLRVFGLNGLVRETFEISGFTSIVDVRTDERDATKGLG